MENLIEFNFGGRKSEVIFTEEIFGGADGVVGYIAKRLSGEGENTLFVFDENTYRLFGPGERFGEGKRCVVLSPGESSKRWGSVRLILESAVKIGLDRSGTVVGVGGGVVGDLAGFAASVYMRGCSLVLVPTTLLAMVDASLGGKTGFDFMGFKNMIGSFYPASEIFVDVRSLEFLPQREYLCGIAEVIKTAMLGDAELFSILENKRRAIVAREVDVVKEIVRRSVMVKGKIVEEDPRESGKRAWLNLGHTFGHALEAVNAFKGINHGEAVAWGLAKAMRLGVKLGITDNDYANRVIRLLESYGFVSEFRGAKGGYGDVRATGEDGNLSAVAFDPRGIIRAMYGDKKKKGGKLRFVLQRNLCDNLIVEGVNEGAIWEIL